MCCLETKFIDMENTFIYQEKHTENKVFSKP